MYQFETVTFDKFQDFRPVFRIEIMRLMTGLTVALAALVLLGFQNCSRTSGATDTPMNMASTTPTGEPDVPSTPGSLPLGCSLSGTCRTLNPEAPKDYQVVQRDSTNFADIQIRVSSLNASASVRLVAATLNGQVVAESRSRTLKVPAGGWYQFWIQELSANGLSVLSEARVSHVGVGEVFLTAGQSNSVAAGETAQPNSSLTSGGFLSGPAFDQIAWSATIDSGAHGSAWPIFASLLSAQLKLPVGVIQVGCGGSSTAQWLPTGSAGVIDASMCGADTTALGGLFLRLVKASNALGSYRALLWHQGESDTSTTTAQTYHDRLALIMARLNTTRTTPVKWFVANAAYFPGSEVDLTTCNFVSGRTIAFASGMLRVRAGQQALWREHLALPGPDTDGLIGAAYRYPGSFGNCVHFSDLGLKVHGQMWYRSVSEAAIVPGSESPSAEVKLPVYRFASATFDFYYSLASTPPNSAYTLQGQAFRLAHTAQPGRASLNACAYTGGAHFLSTDTTCESYTKQGTLGFSLASAAAIESKPLYRFVGFSPQLLFLSTTSMDEGLTAGLVFQGLQAYVY